LIGRRAGKEFTHCAMVEPKNIPSVTRSIEVTKLAIFEPVHNTREVSTQPFIKAHA
jgi:hypothetical protein